MTKETNTLHLIERAAQKLRDGRDPVASELLGRASSPLFAAPPPVAVASKLPLVDDATLAMPPAPPGIDAGVLKRAGMIDWTLNRERLSEEFRIVQGQVLQVMAATTVKPPAMANLVMLTSARPGEGKTFTALNLAGSLASSSLRQVILVDVDSKRHALTSRLGLRTLPGLLNLATDPALDFDDVLLPTSLPALRVLVIGHGERQEALSGGKPIVSVLQRLGRRFPDSIVLLDTPPCLSSSDPSTLAPLVGFVVMLVEAQQTQRAEVESALDLVEACPTVVLMLNKVQLTGSDTFGAYGY